MQKIIATSLTWKQGRRTKNTISQGEIHIKRYEGKKVVARSVCRPCVRVSWQARRLDQAVVVGWRRTLSVRKAVGARPVRLAQNGQRHGCPHASPAIDAAGGH